MTFFIRSVVSELFRKIKELLKTLPMLIWKISTRSRIRTLNTCLCYRAWSNYGGGGRTDEFFYQTYHFLRYTIFLKSICNKAKETQKAFGSHHSGMDGQFFFLVSFDRAHQDKDFGI